MVKYSHTGLEQVNRSMLLEQLSHSQNLTTFNVWRNVHISFKKLLNKNVTVMNIEWKVYGACWHKIDFHNVFLITNNPMIG